MDRDRFVVSSAIDNIHGTFRVYILSMVRRTFVERKIKGSKVVTGVQSKCCLLPLECDCAIRARGLYKPASATPETCTLSLDWTCERTRRSVVCAAQFMDSPRICIYFAPFRYT